MTLPQTHLHPRARMGLTEGKRDLSANSRETPLWQLPVFASSFQGFSMTFGIEEIKSVLNVQQPHGSTVIALGVLGSKLSPSLEGFAGPNPWPSPVPLILAVDSTEQYYVGHPPQSFSTHINSLGQGSSVSHLLLTLTSPYQLLQADGSSAFTLQHTLLLIRQPLSSSYWVLNKRSASSLL